MRQREYGGVPWYLMFTLVASIGAGVGSYVVLHEREVRLAEERARAPKPPPPPPPAPKPPEDPIVPEEKPPIIERPDVEPTPEAAGVGEVTVDQAITMGEIDSVHVEIRVGAQKPAIDKCYENVAGSGTIVFSISIGPVGRVIAVAVVGDAFDRKLGTCVADVLKKVRFNAPSDASPAEATIPIQFKRS